MNGKEQENMIGVDLEKELLNIWRRVLKKDDLTVDDDFFECGGDSLLAMEVLQEFEALTGSALEPSIFFETGTIRLLLKKISVTDEIEPSGSVPDDSGILENHDKGSQLPLRAFISWHIRTLLHKIKYFIISKSPWFAPVSPSYESFLRFQKFWISLPPVHFHFLLRRKIVVFEKWIQLTGQKNQASDLMTRNLMANLWFAIREFLMAQPHTCERWVSVQGLIHLQRAAEEKRGVILVLPHTRALFPAMRDFITAPMFAESIFLGADFLFPLDWVESMVFLTRRFQECRNVLARGGVVWVAPDGRSGVEKISLVRYGRRFPFRAGAAELAAQTGALLIPVFPYLYADGRIEVEFLEPLNTVQKGTGEVNVDDLLRNYAESYVDHWPQLLPGMTFRWQKTRLNDIE
ncbi:MAG: hypothetical protein APR62_11015 [Smithella sp. SDB]|nr:MAG: hypothetical protein APR62_11015 [Smithella sp. SDB]